MHAKFNVARSGVIVQCLGRNRPSTTSVVGTVEIPALLSLGVVRLLIAIDP